MKQWHLWLALALVGLALLAGMAVRHRQPPARVLLPTGETVSVAGVTYGTNHVAPEHYPLERRLPAPVRRAAQQMFHLPPLPPDATTSEPTLLVWLRISPGPSTNVPITPTWCYAALETADGLAGGREQHISLFGVAVQPLQAVEFQTFPRRDRRFTLALSRDVPGASYPNPRVLLGKLPVRNPAPLSPPPWPAPAQPAPMVASGVEGTLEGFVFGVGNSTSHGSLPGGGSRIEFNRAGTNTPPGAAILLRLRPTDGSTNHWTIGDLSSADAAGNVVKSSSSSWGRLSADDPRVHFRWDPVLWPNETWELRILAKREADAAFAPEEQVQFRDVALPAVGVTNQYDVRALPLPTGADGRAADLPKGLALRLESLERRPPAAENTWSDSSVTRLRLKASAWTNGLYLDLIRAVDEQGRELKSGSRGFGMNRGEAEFTYSFRSLPADSRQLHLTFAVHRGVPLTFRLDPSRPLTTAVFGLGK